MNYIKFLSILILASICSTLTSCVTKRTVTDDRGVVVDEAYVVKRPVKHFVNNVEFE